MSDEKEYLRQSIRNDIAGIRENERAIEIARRSPHNLKHLEKDATYALREYKKALAEDRERYSQLKKGGSTMARHRRRRRRRRVSRRRR